MRTRTPGLLIVVAVLATGPTAPAAAQAPDTGGRVFGLVGGGFGDGSSVAVSGGAGIRLTRHLGLDLEVTHLTGEDDLDDDFYIQRGGDVRPLIYPPPYDDERERSLTAFLTRFTVEFPVADGRLFPYLTGGGGVGHVREYPGDRFPYPYPLLDAPVLAEGRLGALGGLILPRGDFEQVNTGLALTLGGGLDVRLWRGLAVGVDARWLRVLRERDNLDVAQVTSRVSYRF